MHEKNSNWFLVTHFICCTIGISYCVPANFTCGYDNDIDRDSLATADHLLFVHLYIKHYGVVLISMHFNLVILSQMPFVILTVND